MLEHGVIVDDASVFNDKLQEMGGLLQLPPTPRRTRWTNPLRTTTTEDHRDLNVTGLRQLHKRADDGNRTPVLSLGNGSSSTGRQGCDLGKRAMSW